MTKHVHNCSKSWNTYLHLHHTPPLRTHVGGLRDLSSTDCCELTSEALDKIKQRNMYVRKILEFSPLYYEWASDFKTFKLNFSQIK